MKTFFLFLSLGLALPQLPVRPPFINYKCVADNRYTLTPTPAPLTNGKPASTFKQDCFKVVLPVDKTASCPNPGKRIEFAVKPDVYKNNCWGSIPGFNFYKKAELVKPAPLFKWLPYSISKNGQDVVSVKVSLVPGSLNLETNADSLEDGDVMCMIWANSTRTTSRRDACVGTDVNVFPDGMNVAVISPRTQSDELASKGYSPAYYDKNGNYVPIQGNYPVLLDGNGLWCCSGLHVEYPKN
jgi:hypothetical protein